MNCFLSKPKFRINYTESNTTDTADFDKDKTINERIGTKVIMEELQTK